VTHAPDYGVAAYLTAELPGIGGRLRATPEDFVVHEIPLYGPSGEGQHTLFEIEKVGISTLEAIRRLALAWHVPERLISSAGLKDADAVTRQYLSVEGIDPEVVRAMQRPELRVLWAERHRNRLKIGHLRGNHFCLRVRDTMPDSMARAQTILAVLERRGVPNWFGYQRFGVRHTSHRLGRCLMQGDLTVFLHVFLGGRQVEDSPQQQRARILYDEGHLAEAAQAWRPQGSPEFRALAMLAQGRSAAAVLDQIPRSLKRLFVSAYQSELFNAFLAQRLPYMDRLRVGDLAMKHVNGAFFAVLDAEIEQPRADALEISPTGPLYGPKMRWPSGAPGDEERDLLAREQMPPEQWRAAATFQLEGGRRPLRVPLTELAVQAEEDGLTVSFTLPAGAYATNVMAELTKSNTPASFDPGSAGEEKQPG
jgi:tRNA pseudouridine13 synthase